MGKTKRGKGTELLVVAERARIRLGEHIASALSAEVTLIKETLAAAKVSRQRGGTPRRNPVRLITDKGYEHLIPPDQRLHSLPLI